MAHGKSTVVKALSGVQTVRFKNELERNITIKLGYANAKIFRCENERCPRPTCYISGSSSKVLFVLLFYEKLYFICFAFFRMILFPVSDQTVVEDSD